MATVTALTAAVLLTSPTLTWANADRGRPRPLEVRLARPGRGPVGGGAAVALAVRRQATRRRRGRRRAGAVHQARLGRSPAHQLEHRGLVEAYRQ